jgi:hypothetical protein
MSAEVKLFGGASFKLESGLTRIRTEVAGFRVLSHYQLDHKTI